MNGGIAPSRSAWMDLPKGVRATARRGAETLDVAVAAVAYGRCLLGWAIRLLIVAIVGVMLFFAVIVAGSRLPWPDGDYPPPALVALVIPAAVMLVMFLFIAGGDRLVRPNIATVAAHPGEDLPSEMRLGTARPRLQLSIIVGFLVAALVALPLTGDGSAKQWIEEAFAVLGVVAVIAAGPAALGLETGVLDRTGIRLDFVDVHVPWASIGSVRVVDPGRIVIEIVRPVAAGAAQPGRWTRAALKRLQPGKYLRIGTARPELAVWVSGGYLVPAAVTSGVRTVDSWRAP